MNIPILVTRGSFFILNNAYYIISGGKVRQTDEPDPSAVKMSINGLAEFIFKDENAEMNFMLN